MFSNPSERFSLTGSLQHPRCFRTHLIHDQQVRASAQQPVGLSRLAQPLFCLRQPLRRDHFACIRPYRRLKGWLKGLFVREPFLHHSKDRRLLCRHAIRRHAPVRPDKKVRVRTTGQTDLAHCPHSHLIGQARRMWPPRSEGYLITCCSLLRVPPACGPAYAGQSEQPGR